MALDLESSATFEDLILDCSARWGHADQSGTLPGIPTDPAVLFEVKSTINRAYRAFLSAYPKWTFATQDIFLTFDPDGTGPDNVAGDPGRYRLPRHVGSIPLTDWTYEGGNAPVESILVLDHELVDRLRAMDSGSAGYPTRSAIKRITGNDQGGSDPRAWEAIFHPSPSAVATVKATFRFTGHQLVSLTDRHIAGREHDETIKAFADHEWMKKDAEDPEMSQRYERERNAKLAHSIALDHEMRARRRGQVIDPSVMRYTPPASRLGPLTFNGAAIP